MGIKVYVGNLPERARQEDIRDTFAKYGHVLNMEIKGSYGFIEYEERRMCDDAIAALHGQEFQGQQLRVEYAHAEKNGYRPREQKSTDTCFKCGQVGHWARECTSSNGREMTSNKGNSRYDDRRLNEGGGSNYTREPYRDSGRDKYDRDDRYAMPSADRSSWGHERYERGPDYEYRRDYRNNWDRNYDRDRERGYDRQYVDREYERYGREPYERGYYAPQRDWDRDTYDRRAVPPPDVPSYPRGRTGSSPPPRRGNYERGMRDPPVPYRGRSPPMSRYADPVMGPPPSVRPPPSPRGGMYSRRRSASPARGGGRGPMGYPNRPRSPSPMRMPPRRGGPRTPTK